MIVELQAKPYEVKTKGDVKRMRKEGKYPAILYGHGEKSRRIYIEHHDLKGVIDILKEEAVIINLKIEEKDYLCVIKSIQQNPITGKLLHIDFQHIHKKEEIKTSVPIHLIGEAPGLKEGGIMEQNLREVVVRCLPTDIPSHIDVDISGLNLSESIHLYDINLPKIKFELSKETPIVSMTVPRAVVVEAKPEAVEVGAEEVAEGGKAPAEEAKEEKAGDKGSKEKEPKPPAKKG
ncbi:MAG: 50S ribosomal protein L25 [bacterium]